MNNKLAFFTNGRFSYFIKNTQQLFSFGHNEHGQLSLGDKFNRRKPTKVNFEKFKKDHLIHIAIGFSYVILLTKSRKCILCGNFSLSMVSEITTPAIIKSDYFKIYKIERVFAADKNSIFLTSSGVPILGYFDMHTFSWELGEWISLKIIKIQDKIIDVSCGSLAILYLSNRNEVYQTGDFDIFTSRYNNEHIPTKVDIKIKVNKISCGDSHALFLGLNGNVYGIGAITSNRYALTADYSNGSDIPCHIKSIESSYNIIDIKCFGNSSCLISDNGTMYGFGSNVFGEDKMTIPYPRRIKNTITQIEGGGGCVFLFNEK